jgi:hypothetical protein
VLDIDIITFIILLLQGHQEGNKHHRSMLPLPEDSLKTLLHFTRNSARTLLIHTESVSKDHIPTPHHIQIHQGIASPYHTIMVYRSLML